VRTTPTTPDVVWQLKPEDEWVGRQLTGGSPKIAGPIAATPTSRRLQFEGLPCKDIFLLVEGSIVELLIARVHNKEKRVSNYRPY
jgi:hypothetical protein